jgi:hypothetical protein
MSDQPAEPEVENPTEVVESNHPFIQRLSKNNSPPSRK